MIKIEELTQITTKEVGELNILYSQVSSSGKMLTFDGLLKFIKNIDNKLIVAREGGKIIGMGSLIIFYKISEKNGKIEHVVVDEFMRGQGIGEKLCEKLIEIAKENRVIQIELTSRASRVAANKLYQKLGFEKKETNVYRMKL